MVAKPDKWARIRYTCAFCSQFFYFFLFASLFFRRPLCVWRHLSGGVRLSTRFAVAISTGLWKCLFFTANMDRKKKKIIMQSVDETHVSMWVRVRFFFCSGKMFVFILPHSIDSMVLRATSISFFFLLRSSSFFSALAYTTFIYFYFLLTSVA